MILVDTNVWIDHLRKGDSLLVHLLEEDLVLVHPWVYGEIALGSINRRDEFLALLSCLPAVPVMDSGEQGAFIESKGLWNRGIGWVDAQLLAACTAYPCRIYTRDSRLHACARELGIAMAEG